MAGMDRASQRSVVEVALVFVLIGAFLWFGRRAFPGVNLVFAVALLTILVYAHRRAGEGWREIGFRWDTFGATSWLLLPAVFLGCALIVGAAVVLDETRIPPLTTGLRRTALFVVFGIAQQYVMLGFIFKRVQRAADARFAPALTALLFALLHLPNIFLTAVTFVWGVVACLVYRRSPNLWANGLAHGLFAALLYYALPRSVTGGLRVGMEYVLS
jgi:membrane protease YdiL (CAAX protease family)